MKNFKSIWLTHLPTISKDRHASSYFLLHDLLRGRDPKSSGFTPITNKVKLENGQRAWQGLEHASRGLYHQIKSYQNPIMLELIEASGIELEELEQRRVAATSKK